ncbi:hypothetical protein D3C80_1028040 [compost metagenome]
MHALADGHCVGSVRLGALAGGVQPVGVDVHRPQLHGRAVVCRHQHIAAIALALSLQATVGQQADQPFIDAVAAFQACAAQIAGLCGVERNGHARLHAKLGDGIAQRAGRDVVGGLALGHGLGRHQQQPRRAGQGHAEHYQAHGLAQLGCRGGVQMGHCVILPCHGRKSLSSRLVSGTGENRNQQGVGEIIFGAVIQAGSTLTQ